MKDALDALLDRYAPEAGAGWLAAETPDIVPEHPFSSKFRRRMERLIRRQGRSPAVTARPPLCPPGRRRMPWSSSLCPSPV